ncbi:rod shape-determining protein MreD [Patescibacteria group bacterium]
MFYLLVTMMVSTLLILQISFLPFLDIQNVFPHIVLVSLIMWLVLIDFDFSIGIAVITGFVLDMYSVTFFGSHFLAFAATLFIIKLFVDKYVIKESFSMTVLFVAGGTIFFLTILVILNWLAGVVQLSDYIFDAKGYFLYTIPISVFWSVLFCFILWRPFKKISNVVSYFRHRLKNA